MSGTCTPLTPLPDRGERWAALDQRNERLVDASHPLLAELAREHAIHDQRRAEPAGEMHAAS